VGHGRRRQQCLRRRFRRRQPARDYAGLLPGDENVAALEGKQQGGGAEVKVRPARRVVVGAGPAAPDVTGGHLPCPDDLAGFEIEGEDGVAGFAGGLGIVVAGGDVEHAALGIDGRSGPNACAGRTVLRSADGIDAGLFQRRDGVGLPDDGAVADAERDDDECRGAHGTIGLEGPVEAASLCVHGVNDAAGAADKQNAAQNGGRGEGGDVALEAEGPFELEVAHLGGSQVGLHRGLKASVRGGGAPAGPARGGAGGDGELAARAKGGGGGSVLDARDAKKPSDGFALAALERIGDAHHDAEVQSMEDAGNAELLQSAARRNARAGMIVASGAILLIGGFAGIGTRARPTCAQEECGGSYTPCQPYRNSAGQPHGMFLPYPVFRIRVLDGASFIHPRPVGMNHTPV